MLPPWLTSIWLSPPSLEAVPTFTKELRMLNEPLFASVEKRVGG